MNANDRKRITKLIEELELFNGKLEDIKNQIEELRDAEQEKFDNMSDGLQQSDRGQAIEASASYLDEAFGNAEEAFSLIESVVESLNTASE